MVDEQKDDDRRYKNLNLGGRPEGDNDSIASDELRERIILRGITNEAYFDARAEKASNLKFGAKDLCKEDTYA